MGLDTTHNCWHGPYGSFNRFRYSLASQIGVNLDEYEGYGGTDEKKIEDIRHGIMPLLNHSDCDGTLSVEESKIIVGGLNDILENFKEDLPHDFNFKEKIIQFRDGCINAIENNEEIEFR